MASSSSRAAASLRYPTAPRLASVGSLRRLIGVSLLTSLVAPLVDSLEASPVAFWGESLVSSLTPSERLPYHVFTPREFVTELELDSALGIGIAEGEEGDVAPLETSSTTGAPFSTATGDVEIADAAEGTT